MQYLKIFTLLIIALSKSIAITTELPAIQAIFNFFGQSGTEKFEKYKDPSFMTPQELGISVGKCDNHFYKYISHYDRRHCYNDDKTIQHILPPQPNSGPAKKPPIMVKCMQLQPKDNVTTGYTNTLQVMTGVTEIIELLKPIGNTTKRHEPGSCVLVLFYTETSLGCAHVARYTNMLPLIFPTLRIAAIDAFKFPSFNTEFGIIGLPTLLLFHQGRPIVKFYSDFGTFASFITRHTGIKPIETVPSEAEISGPLPLQPILKTDANLILAWGFILLGLAYYFANSRLCKQVIEMIQKNWRESEAQMEQQH